MFPTLYVFRGVAAQQNRSLSSVVWIRIINTISAVKKADCKL